MSDTSAKPAEEIIEQARKLQRERDAAIKRAQAAEADAVHWQGAFYGVEEQCAGTLKRAEVAEKERDRLEQATRQTRVERDAARRQLAELREATRRIVFGNQSRDNVEGWMNEGELGELRRLLDPGASPERAECRVESKLEEHWTRIAEHDNRLDRIEQAVRVGCMCPNWDDARNHIHNIMGSGDE